jgi:hypothetical protein
MISGWNYRASAFVLMLALASPGLAQTGPDPQPTSSSADGKRTFRPEFFASYVPVSALDMVQRIPGFSIDGGDGRRGFGENAGNVLIDGDRPSTKSDDIFAILSRIPASQVDVIVLSEQAGSDGEARGQGQVVNVVRKTSTKLSGTYEGGVEFGERSGKTPFGSASATLKRGVTSYEVSAAAYNQFNRFSSVDTTFDGARRVTAITPQEGNNHYKEASLSGAIKTKAGTTKINLNGRFNWKQFRDQRDSIIFDGLRQPLGTEILRTRGPNPDTGYEVGGDVEFPLASKLKTKIISLYRASDEKGQGLFETSLIAGGVDRFSTTSRSRPSETVFRVQNDWSGLNTQAIQFGGEIAYNKLRAAFGAISSSNGTATNFPASNVTVAEWRVEPFVSDVWTISPSWKLESAMVVEASSLKLSGDSSARRRFVFAKPKLIATWTANKDTTLEFRAERDVAQLDFTEFATSVDLGFGAQVSAGNSDLVPEKTLKFSAQVRRKFMDRGSIQLTGSYVKVSDTQDLVPIIVRDAAGIITSRFDGAGNIGNSKRWNAELEITLPFDWITQPIGISGMELKYVGHYHGARVIDPVTGRARGRSNEPVWHQEWNFRHDIAKLGIAWGFTANQAASNYDYFFNQIARYRTGAEFFAFVEYKKWKAGTIRFQVGNPTNVHINRDRFFYDDTRASGRIIRTIERDRFRDARFQLSLSGKF